MEQNIVNDVRLLQGNFILATPLLIDPLFEKSIIFMSEFKEGSAYGFLIDYILKDFTLFQKNEINLSKTIFDNADVFLGGPVDTDHLCLVHSNDLFCKKSLQVSDCICITNLKDALKTFNKTPAFYKIIAGYCYWKMGQLEDEIKKGWWLFKNFSSDLFFMNSRRKWKNSIESLNVDSKRFSIHDGVA